MLENDRTQPELAAAGAIQKRSGMMDSEGWFEYLVRVYPHHTDYSGAVWHGTYLTWMEEARVESLRSLGIEYAEWVAQGVELPVVELSLRYHRSVQMGQSVAVRTRMAATEGVRLLWDYEIRSPDAQELYVTAQVTLVGVDRDKGKIIRQLPPALKEALTRLSVKPVP
ncbi:MULTISPECIES: thioesterase family protein [unclassified Microcoleus]|uniref:acyl-CoA thioesterase n=1 Tax=unclassified Microcoleus TaxID=2642155 RepID=UPI001D5F3DA4|nr:MULTISPECIES: thioesterase family protein [unclassified Microcoleus]TAE10527.1 MAG: acyl-CoA thioesterase [Oscillatoriales cyanobacterium]MCC3413369.1 acyl-CoA thioesterase [Microcoleus sp. PH2017_02_FOX_O_A]MCC3517001.1 acyl-CoA thioesterase [Microcoleus sp. PH2017_18_LLB_O_A]MCC3536575.1 acyl-CoA thioesterase [Microcoleus sp. PH2017_25_DOB_D_A]MCC3548614.1 acyl-CoA thioesterase [Microcoleus sp. PH2017_24_DOB_U_A]